MLVWVDNERVAQEERLRRPQAEQAFGAEEDRQQQAGFPAAAQHASQACTTPLPSEAHSVGSIAHAERLSAPLVVGALCSHHASVHQRGHLGQACGRGATLRGEGCTSALLGQTPNSAQPAPSSLTRTYGRVSAEKRTSQLPSPAADAARAEQLGIADQPTHLHTEPGLGSKLHLPAQQGGSAAVGVGPQRVVVAAGRQRGKCGGVEGILAPVAVAGGVRMLPSIMLFAIACSRPCPANSSQTD